MELARAVDAIERLNNVLNCVRNQNSGADIHCIGNIRNTASGFISVIENDYELLDACMVDKMVKRCERSVVEFFEKKYGVMPLITAKDKAKSKRT